MYFLFGALIFVAFWLGFVLAAILRAGKIDDMWRAIELSAYKNDNSRCRELLEMR